MRNKRVLNYNQVQWVHVSVTDLADSIPGSFSLSLKVNFKMEKEKEQHRECFKHPCGDGNAG